MPEPPDNPVLTVVTIVRNDAPGLSATAASIRNQTSADFEWLVIDGASTDATSELLQSLADRGRVVSEPDEGIYDAMNKGLRLAHGEFVLFMNAGDVFATATAVEEILEASTTVEAPPDMVIGSSFMLLPGGRRLRRNTRNPRRYIRHGLPALHQAIAFRTALHRQFPYPPDYHVSADYAVVAWMVGRGARVVDTGTVLSTNEIGGDSFSYRNHEEHLRDVWRVQEEILGLPHHLIILSRIRGRVSRALVTLTSAWSRFFPPH